MSDVSQLGGGDTPSPPYTVSPIAGGAYPAGTAVKLNSSGQAVPAKADTFADAVTVGVLRNASFAGAPADVSWGSSVPFTLSQLESVIDGSPSTGFVPGDTYYVSPTNAGNLTNAQPTGSDFIMVVGVAESATSLFLRLGQPVIASA